MSKWKKDFDPLPHPCFYFVVFEYCQLSHAVRFTTCSFMWKWSAGRFEWDRSAGRTQIESRGWTKPLSDSETGRPGVFKSSHPVGQNQFVTLPSFTRKNRPWTA